MEFDPTSTDILGLKPTVILDFTKFDSNTHPLPFPPVIVIFGFVWYPIPGLITLIDFTSPLKFKWAFALDPCSSWIIICGTFIT